MGGNVNRGWPGGCTGGSWWVGEWLEGVVVGREGGCCLCCIEFCGLSLAVAVVG